MSSAVFVTFLDSPIQHTVPFEGPAISLRDLKAILPSFCGLKILSYDIHILDKDGTDYTNEDDMIVNNSNLVATKIFKNKGSNAAKFKPSGLPPDSYRCNKCHEVGHWIYDCPGLTDSFGRSIDFRNVKRPTGIPTSFLLEVPPGTTGAYLTREGKYMMPVKDHEVHLKNKEVTPIFVENKNNDISLLNFHDPIYSQFPKSISSLYSSSLYPNYEVKQQRCNNNINYSVFTPNTSSCEYSSFNEVPLQRTFEAQYNHISSVYLPNNSTYESILSKDEFYERQSELKAENSHYYSERSRSPIKSVKRRDNYKNYNDDDRSRRGNYKDTKEYRYDKYRNKKKSYQSRRDS